MGDTLKTLATTLAVQMLGSMALLTVPVLAPAAARDVGVPAAYVGLYIALAYGASMMSSLACGDLIRRFGAIRVSQLCLLLCALGSLLAAGGTLGFFAASALFMGMGYGPMTPASSHVLARTTSATAMSLVFSVKQTGVPLGGAVAGALVPALVVGIGWPWSPPLAYSSRCLRSESARRWTRTGSRGGAFIWAASQGRCAWCSPRPTCGAWRSCPLSIPRCSCAW